eukprot:5808537-Pyramimonas_sp.AAC.1
MGEVGFTLLGNCRTKCTPPSLSGIAGRVRAWPPMAAARIPRKRGAIGPGEGRPAPSNAMFQAGCWSCGLWASC